MELDLALAADFLVLAEIRHYGRSAARLNMTSSALTKRVQRLERQVEVVLLERGPSGVVDLTPAGRRFAEAARPLLVQARAARSSAHAGRPGRGTALVRFGIPAGSAPALERLDLAHVGRRLRREHPGARLACVDVDFADMTRCLLDGRVDVLWTDAPVRHTAVTSVRLGLTSGRVGVVGAGHPLADAGSVDVDVFLDEPMLFNPAVPAEWMSPFWLGDLRGSREARLVAVDARHHAAVLDLTLRLDAVVVSLEVSAGLLGPAHRAVALTGAPPVVFHAARRRVEPRGEVLTTVEALLALGSHTLGASASGVQVEPDGAPLPSR